MAGKNWTAVAAFFCGATLGVLTGMLLAPKSGEEMRQDLAERLNDGADRVRDASRTVARRARQVAEDAQKSVSDLADAGLRAARKISPS
jgi:gas vesicle protein